VDAAEKPVIETLKSHFSLILGRRTSDPEPLELFIAEHQVSEIRRSIRHTRIPVVLFGTICIFSAWRWPHGAALIPFILLQVLLALSAPFLLIRLSRVWTRSAAPVREMRAIAVLAGIMSLGWALVLTGMILFSPANERLGWVTLEFGLACIGMTVFGFVPLAGAVYALNLLLALALTLLFAHNVVPPGNRFVQPIFFFMVVQINLRIFGQVHSHLVATWSLRAHQAQREIELARTHEREAAELAQTHLREEQRQREMEEQKRNGTLQIADHYEQSVAAHAQELEEVVGSLVGAIERINHAGAAVRSSAEAMLGLAADSTEATKAVALSTDRLSVAAEDIGGQVEQQRAAAAESDRAGEQAQATLDLLSRETDRIGEIVELVQSLASQTNLLALNAAIEASRAGDAGRGFAVVAAEVKQLAAQTHGAIGRIGEIVEATRSRMQVMQGSMTAIAHAADEAADRTDRIVGAVDNQRQATRTIGLAADSTAGVAGRLRHVAEQVVTDISTTDKHTREIQGAIQALRTRSQALSETSDTFLAQLRSSAG
jgi:methyl-accepting chemotaxis protein